MFYEILANQYNIKNDHDNDHNNDHDNDHNNDDYTDCKLFVYNPQYSCTE